MHKILIVFGTRPEAIKMVPIIKVFEKNKHLFDIKICITAQHRGMLDQVMSLFKIKADYDLNLMKPGQNLFDLTSEILLGVRPVLEDFLPDIVFVHGDTTTSVATALAAYYMKIKVAHVEAGLRTYNIYSPWPEEMNRQLTARLATWNFTPTELSKRNLLSENITEKSVFVTGNTVIDTLNLVIKKISNEPSLKDEIIENIRSMIPNIERYISDMKIILITGHRRENFGEGFLNMCNAIKEIAERHSNVIIIYPVHLNPNVQKPVYEILKEIKNVYLIPPLNYLSFIYLMNHSYFILTDSGGIQEEAPGLGKPVLVMRDTTERPEGVDAGTVKLVGTSKAKIVSESISLLTNKEVYNEMSSSKNPYGVGDASKKIIAYLTEQLERE